MGGWIVSLIVTLVISLGSLVPGALGSRLADTLRERLAPARVEAVEVVGDPLLQLPFGEIPALKVSLGSYRVAGLVVRHVALDVTHLKLDPFALYVQHTAKLRAPAHAALDLRLDTADLQSFLGELESRGALSGLQAQVTFFGQRLGGTLSLHRLVLLQAGDRLVLSGEAQIQETGATLPFQASSGLGLDAQGHGHLVDPRLALNGHGIPAMLLAPQIARLNDWLDPSRWGLPLRPVSLAIEPTGPRLRAEGTLETLDRWPGR